MKKLFCLALLALIVVVAASGECKILEYNLIAYKSYEIEEKVNYYLAQGWRIVSTAIYKDMFMIFVLDRTL